VQQGVVEKVELPADSKTGFQMAERFFNIWYLMRASPAHAAPPRLAGRISQALLWDRRDPGPCGAGGKEARRPRGKRSRGRFAELAFAYAQAVNEPVLRWALDGRAIEAVMNTSQRIDEILDLTGKGRLSQAGP